MKNLVIVDMLVKNGMAVNEAVEAMGNYTEADYLAEVEAEALEDARWEEEQRLAGCDDYELDRYEWDFSDYADDGKQGYWEDGEWWAI